MIYGLAGDLFLHAGKVILCIENIDIAKVDDAFGNRQVSFTKIEPSGVNEQLFDYVFQNNLYDINESNILLMPIPEKYISMWIELFGV